MIIKKVLEFDKKSSEALRVEKTRKFLWISTAFFAHSGDSWWWLIGLFILWLLGKIWSLVGANIVEVCALLAIGIVSLVVIIFSIKLIVRRSRPKGEWGRVYRNTDPHSFPSGHAARTFLIAVVLLAIGPLWLGLVAFLWAILVSIARVSMGVHYFSDIAVGMIIGILWGIVMVLIRPYFATLLPFVFS